MHFIVTFILVFVGLHLMYRLGHQLFLWFSHGVPDMVNWLFMMGLSLFECLSDAKERWDAYRKKQQEARDAHIREHQVVNEPENTVLVEKAEPDAEEKKDKKIVKELKRLPLQAVSWRAWLSRHFRRMEEGKGSEETRQLWQSYTQCVPEKYRHVERDNPDLKDPLPYWLEQLLALFNSVFLQLVVLFAILILTSHFWLPLFMTPTTMSPLHATQLELTSHFAFPIVPCVWASSGSRDEIEGPCFIHSYDQLSQSALLNLSLQALNFTLRHRPVNHTLDVLNQESGALLYPIDFVIEARQAWRYNTLQESAAIPSFSHWLTGTSSNTGATMLSSDGQCDIKSSTTTTTSTTSTTSSAMRSTSTVPTQLIRRYVNAAQDLQALLVHMHREEVRHRRRNNPSDTTTLQTSQPCICGLFLNIVSNVSFLYDSATQSWLVMARPFIQRNNSFAELVASNIKYNEHSLLFKKHRQWQHLVDESDDLIHYDSFVVEYTDTDSSLLAASNEELDVLRTQNELLREAEFKEASLFRRVHEADLGRRQLPMSGEDAICFVYCETLLQRYNSE